jgi:hypothetical protein
MAKDVTEWRDELRAQGKDLTPKLLEQHLVPIRSEDQEPGPPAITASDGQQLVGRYYQKLCIWSRRILVGNRLSSLFG